MRFIGILAQHRRRMTLFVVGGLALVAALAWAADRWAFARAQSGADVDATQAALNHSRLLASELQKFRLLPVVLAENPEAVAALSGSASAIARSNAMLESLARRTGAAQIYLIGNDGRTLAASNYRAPDSFVGQDYGFRPYFRDSLANGAAELFALGTVSRRPGLYLARRIERAGKALGVIVVKVEFDSVENVWARSRGATFVADANGIILVTSIAPWRFRSLGVVAPDVIAKSQRTLQFGAQPPRPLGLTISGRDAILSEAGGQVRYRIAFSPAPFAGARLYHLAAIGDRLAAARNQALLMALSILLVAGTASGLVLRSIEKARLQREARAALETAVETRTGELREANAALVLESEQRILADERFRAAREELAQASRLGTLGQVTAGVAHEINQPVAAIRAFAESGKMLLARGSADEAREPLSRIIELADRIGMITGELRAFARRSDNVEATATFGKVIDGVRLLLGEKARALVVFESGVLREMRLKGDRVRIEQILVNLIQNAIDSVQDTVRPMIRVSAERHDASIVIMVEDNGAAIPGEIAGSLFNPFVTTKTGGLGLGLAIARDLARQFGGELSLASGPTGTKRFELRLLEG